MMQFAITLADRHLAEIIRHRQDVQVDEHGYRDHPTYVYNNITLHSRGFLWELVAAFDLTLCWMNERFNLGLDAHKVTWHNVEAKCKASADPKCAAAFAEVDSTHSSDWFSAVTRYRNYAHRNIIVAQGMSFEDKDPLVLWPRALATTPYLEDLTVLLTDYLDKFRGYATRLAPLMA